MLVKPRQFSPHSYPNGDHLSPARFPLFHAGHMKQHHITIIKKINRPFCFQQNICEICNPIIKDALKGKGKPSSYRKRKTKSIRGA